MYAPRSSIYTEWSTRRHTKALDARHVDIPMVRWRDSELMNPIENAVVTDVARRISRYSLYTTHPVYTNVRLHHDEEPPNPFGNPDVDPELDPNSDSFDAEQWLRNFLQIQSRDPDQYPHRTAGVSFHHLSVYGYTTPTDYQGDVANVWLKAVSKIRRLIGLEKPVRVDILREFEGLVHSGEMLLVLGRPGSGCSTLLRTLAGETQGLHLQEISNVQYQGISYDEMRSCFRGEVIYQAERETHFPELTAGETLSFAAHARVPANRLPGISREQHALHMRDVVMATLGLTHTVNTKVGNDFIRGVSGGERKRISIAEVMLCKSPIQCWDNSTQGLDSSTALEFVRSLRNSTYYTGSTAIVAIYQAGQAIYDLFDKVILLYEGREIFFGPTQYAKGYFIDMGFECPERQTTADFLTSLTNPSERRVRRGYENRVPRTADQFAARWQNSPQRLALLADISAYERKFPLGGDRLLQFQRSRQMEKSRRWRSAKSPYTLSYPQQIRLCLWRASRRLRANFTATVIQIVSNVIMSFITASIFYNLAEDTNSAYPRSTLLFSTILMTSLDSAMEILPVWVQRPMVEKHNKYALYHPSADAISSIIIDLPIKLLSSSGFCLGLYFLTNLRRSTGHFFIFYVVTFISMLVMSNLFRWLGAVSKTLDQAMIPSSLLLLALFIYTGFVIPVPDMRPWFQWITYINPIAYTFEALMVNEFSGRQFSCSLWVPAGPAYMNLGPKSRICSSNGAVAGQPYVSGDAYIESSYKYSPKNLGRDIIILIVFFVVSLVAYIGTSEVVRSKPSKGEVLVFPRKKMPAFGKHLRQQLDEELATFVDMHASVKQSIGGGGGGGGGRGGGGGGGGGYSDVFHLKKRQPIFHWQDICYDIKIKDIPRRLLDHVDGWVRPGTLTALMGVSGAGKTTLLDVLADRVTVGVVTGSALVDGRPRDGMFQRKTGYVQQQDVHLDTTTVREALIFSATLRQPASVPRSEKLAYVEEVIEMLGMQDYADAVVGKLGQGLNMEQRKRLSIGVEMAAKPELLLFFDEPTSGLDSQTAWSICQLMRKLADHGQAILCTIHQPSAVLMQEFDQLLLLARGGRTVYFGPLGHQMKILIDYFERNGASPCPSDGNPAEWMLDVIGAGPGSRSDIDWPEQWKNSPERQQVRHELERMKEELSQRPRGASLTGTGEFATPFKFQLKVCTQRAFQQYWRTPAYVYSKFFLGGLPALFIGFTFWHEPTSVQGLKDQTFGIFMLAATLSILVLQMMPYFIIRRKIYEVRERPSRIYSWKVFIISSIVVELSWNILVAVPMFLSFYYPIAMYRNAEVTGDVVSRGGMMFLLFFLLMVFASTFSIMVIAGIETLETGGNIASPMLSLSLVFCGVLRNVNSLPKVWVALYRVSPFTYFMSSLLSTGVSGGKVQCSSVELLHLEPPAGQTCGQFMKIYMNMIGGYVVDPDATSNCQYCQLNNTDVFLKTLSISFHDYRRNIGLIFVYIVFNVGAAVFLYWLCRVPKSRMKKA